MKFSLASCRLLTEIKTEFYFFFDDSYSVTKNNMIQNKYRIYGRGEIYPEIHAMLGT